MRRSVTRLLITSAVVLAARQVRAQGISAAADTSAAPPAAASMPASPGAPHTRRRPAFIGVRVATAWHSSFPTRMGQPAYRDFYVLDLRAGWTIAASEEAALEYTPSVTPLAITTGNPDYVPASKDCSKGCPTPGGNTVPVYHTVYGFGLAPLGFQLRFFPRAPVRPVVHMSAGVLRFTRPVPDPAATRFNFTAETGGGLEFALPRHHTLTIGYAFHHTSNGGTGQVNPGVNSGVVIVGITAGR
jgi:hypothetical protein